MARSRKRKITRAFAELVAPYGFELDPEPDKESKMRVSFFKKEPGKTYFFTFRFRLRTMTFTGGMWCEIDVAARLEYHVFNQIRATCFPLRLNDQISISSDLGLYINEKNKDGFVNFSGDGFVNFSDIIILTVDQLSPENIVAKLFHDYFIAGMLRFISETATLEKLDALINAPSLEAGKFRPRVHFAHNRPGQVIVGMIVAKLVSNPLYAELKEIYEQYIREEKLEKEMTGYFELMNCESFTKM